MFETSQHKNVKLPVYRVPPTGLVIQQNVFKGKLQLFWFTTFTIFKLSLEGAVTVRIILISLS